MMYIVEAGRASRDPHIATASILDDIDRDETRS